MSCPPKAIRPASAASCPLNCAIKVVLPAPFGPMTACNSPFRTSKERSSVATMPPKRLQRPVTRRSASAIAALPRAVDNVRERDQQAIDAAAREQDDDEQQRPEHDLPVLSRLYRTGRIERPH